MLSACRSHGARTEHTAEARELGLDALAALVGRALEHGALVVPVQGASLRALTPAALLDAGQRLVARGLARQTTRNAWGSLRACLKDAVHARELGAERWGELSAVTLPRLDVARETETEEPWSFLTVEEIARVLALPLTPAQRAAFETGIYTGLRAGELHALRWSDLHLEGAMPRVVVARSRKGATNAGGGASGSSRAEASRAEVGRAEVSHEGFGHPGPGSGRTSTSRLAHLVQAFGPAVPRPSKTQAASGN